jgi:hypothetical protein
MGESASQMRYRDDARVLAELGASFGGVELPSVEVRLPVALAEQATAAWERDEYEDVPGDEDFEQQLLRHQAAVLALIGLAITHGGRRDGDEVVIELSAGLVGVAQDIATA